MKQTSELFPFVVTNGEHYMVLRSGKPMKCVIPEIVAWIDSEGFMNFSEDSTGMERREARIALVDWANSNPDKVVTLHPVAQGWLHTQGVRPEIFEADPPFMSEETPLGEALDGGSEDCWADQYDNDPNPYHGDYSEE